VCHRSGNEVEAERIWKTKHFEMRKLRPLENVDSDGDNKISEQEIVNAFIKEIKRKKNN
jgi:hypothetical protein